MEPRSILSTHEASQWMCPDWRARIGWTVGFVTALGFLFCDLMTSFLSRWSTEPQYSHGFAVPIIAAGLAWFLKDRIPAGVARSCGWGLPLLAAGAALHVLGVYLFIEAADCLGLLLSITGGGLLIWGRRAVIGIWPAILFLIFMFPLPFRVERMLSDPLQLYGAEQAAYYIQMFGIPAVARGSLILMGDHKLGVAEACSGMRMLTVFFAISAATIIITRRSMWEKAIILLSAVPIALICNIGRIVATALAHNWFGQETADLVFHDLSGWLMMPSAMALLYALLKVLDWLFVAAPEADDKLRPVRRHVLAGVPTVAGFDNSGDR
ncbi:MAG: exosortase/archaeosortase family protein [Fuerstiella sp.]